MKKGKGSQGTSGSVLHRGTCHNSGELLVINKLRSLSIYAASGKASEFRRLDVVAWGCVKIEVKTARRGKKGAFSFGMGKKRGKEKDRSDLVVLVCIDDRISYHVLPSTHAAFYHPDGRAKKGVQYDPSPSHRKGAASLDNETMARYLNRWEQIEERRQKIINEMAENYAEPELTEDKKQPKAIDSEENDPQMRLL